MFLQHVNYTLLKNIQLLTIDNVYIGITSLWQ